MIVLHPDSHRDHLSGAQLTAAMQLASRRLPESGVAVITVELPPDLHALTPLDTETRIAVALEVLTVAADAAHGHDPYGDAGRWLERAIADARAVLREAGR